MAEKIQHHFENLSLFEAQKVIDAIFFEYTQKYGTAPKEPPFDILYPWPFKYPIKVLSKAVSDICADNYEVYVSYLSPI